MKEAPGISEEITDLIKIWEPKLKSLPVETITQRRNSQNRTIKQILGHLIDSTSNNIHRIVHLQNLPSPLIFPNYASMGNNDRWISIQNYQGEDWMNMIQYLKYSLYHYCYIIQNINDEKLNNQWIAGPGKMLSLQELVTEFLKHFKLHLSEIEELILLKE
jgi:hypothetical protein